ncbi:MAG: polysaccharide biosynthesis/export family protein [Terracidiphilus sp.]|jgi:polysaccharide export outer membrane protein
MAKTLARAMTFWFLLCAQTMAGMAQQSSAAALNPVPPLRIGSGDLIEVSMFENPDLSGRYRVDEKGDITVPLIGRVHVDGMTANEAAAKIEQLYVDGQILLPADSHATVFIAEYATQGVTINGEVKAPGVYPALGVHKLNDLIAAAGGITPAAASHVVITHKDDPRNPTTVEYNPSALKPIIPDVQIFPGDSILIPRAGVVYVAGNVAKPGIYVLDGRRALTVEEAMTLAGGGGKASALKRVQLVRTMDDGRKEAITIPVNLIFKGQAPDLALVDGDILYVPTSNARLITEQVINSALGIGTSVVVYRTASGQ